MNILHVTPYYAPAWGYGGVVRAVYELSKAQAAAGHTVTVLTTDTLMPGQRIAIRQERIDGVQVIRQPNLIAPLRRVNLGTPSPIGWRNALNAIRRDHTPDVIHCHELRTVETLLTTRFVAPERIPIVVTPHGTLPQGIGRSAIKQGWDRVFGKALAERITGWIALNEAEAQDIQQWQAQHARPDAERKLSSVAIIPNGVDMAAFDWSRVPHNPQTPTVLFLGRLQARKGVQFLIPAFARVVKIMGLPHARLLIVGPDEGMLLIARQLAANSGVAGQVTFPGLLTGTGRDQALQSADVFVLPAIGEGLSVAALEAMAAALPVILTPGCNLPEAETVGAGLIVPRTIDAIAEGLITLLRDPDRRHRMGEAGRAWMTQAFAWPNLAARTVAFYAQLQGKGSLRS